MSTRCSKFHVSSWIRPQYTPNIMNIIFWTTKFDYSMHLQFKFEVCKKNSTKRKKLTKYNKKSQNCPKFEQGVLNNVGRPHKKMRQKKTIKKFFPECLPWHSTKRSFAECHDRALGKASLFAECQGATLGKAIFLVLTAWAGWAVK